jgi:acetylornithine/succinyldiaminopimelate/putrescine aminotransferase
MRMDSAQIRPPGPDLAELLEHRPGEAMALNQRYLNRQLGKVVQTLGFDREWVRGQGSHLIDREGNEYLDLISGHGVFAVGRGHPHVKRQLHGVIDADTASLTQIGVSTFPGALAEELVRRAPAPIDAAIFTNSGAESIEAALKLARAATGRPRILYCDRGFHGLTLGALSINGNDEFRERFGPLLPGCDPVRFGDTAALATELRRGDVAAFVVEPVQGKGVHLPPERYLQTAQDLCRETGSLFVLDEVQTGIGRTGRFFTAEHWDLQPDLITLSKALSGGYVPIGAVLASRAVFDATFDSMERSVIHSSTFANGDLAAAAALATLAVIDAGDLVSEAERLGNLLLALTEPLVERFEIVREVRGLGMIWGIELGPPPGFAAKRVWEAIERRQPGLFAQMVVVPLFHEHRILTQVAGHHVNVIKALPPLTVSEQDLRHFATALASVLEDAEQRMFRNYASLGFSLGRRSLTAG